MGDIKTEKASNLSMKLRPLREHLFRSPRNSNILKETLDMDLRKNSGNLLIELTNKTPHNFPTGFPGRVGIIDISFNDAENKLISSKKIMLKIDMLDSDGKPTLGAIATKAGSDTRLKPLEKKIFGLDVPKETKNAVVKVIYRLLPEGTVTKMDIQAGEFKKNYEVISKTIDF
jgi:hypothetical protein